MKKPKPHIFWILLVLPLAFCSKPGQQEEDSLVLVEEEPFGEVDGKKVMLYTISNQQGLTVKITN